MPPNSFGRVRIEDVWEDFASTYQIYYENKEWGFVFDSVSFKMRWGLNSLGRYEIDDPNIDPFPGSWYLNTYWRKMKAKADLYPEADNIPLRTTYCSPLLSERHEFFHAMDYLNNYYLREITNAETNIESIKEAVTLQNLNMYNVLEAHRASFNGIARDAGITAYNDCAGGAEVRAYADGAPFYRALSDSIKP